jgi:LPS sulfotransferase NodH
MTYFDELHHAIGALASKQVFFIGGSPKSGTTWLQLLLDAHPAVACKGESQIINHLAQLMLEILEKQNHLVNQKNTTVFAELPPLPLYTRDDLAYLVGTMLLLFLARADPGGERAAVGEKTPDNVRFFRVLQAIFPNAKFIHVVRDGRDCAISGWFHARRIRLDWDSWEYAPLDKYTAMFAREWAKDLAEGMAFAEAWPGVCLTVRYEDLAADPMPALRGILDFLGVASDAATLAACRDAATFDRLSGGRPAGRENRDSFFRNGKPGDWRRYLDAGHIADFKRAAGSWLDRFGYS